MFSSIDVFRLLHMNSTEKRGVSSRRAFMGDGPNHLSSNWERRLAGQYLRNMQHAELRPRGQSSITSCGSASRFRGSMAQSPMSVAYTLYGPP